MFYILLVAILNIVVGFAVAVRLGGRYRTIAIADQRWEFDRFSKPAEERPTQGDAEAETDEGFGVEAQEQNEASETLSEQTDTERETEVPELDAEVSEKDERPQEKSRFAMAVEALQAEAEGFNDRLTEADDQLRACLDAPETAEIEGVLGSLREATDDYIQKRNTAHETLNTPPKNDEAFDSMQAEIEAAIANQNKSMESVHSKIDSFDYDGDLQDGCRQMIDETGKLIDDNRQLASQLDKSALEVARRENRLGTRDDALQRDSLTGVLNRAGLEANMDEWWEGDPDRTGQLSMVMLDLDNLEKVNAEHGQKTGNAVIRSIAQLFTKELEDQGSVARVSGRRFLLTCPDTDVREATRVAEHMRQTLEKVSFLRKEVRIKITVSCAVAETTPEDTTETLFSRVETTLLEARRYGHNRTFLFEGDHPAPVVPPSFGLSEKEVVI